MEVVPADDIRRIFTMKETMETIEEFYRKKKGEYISPDRMHIEDGENTALLMPAFYGDYYAVKLVGVAPGNTEVKKATIHGTMILHDRQTMQPLFLCDAMAVTALRTGALGGLGMKYLAGKEARSLGIIGTGTQGWSHLQSAVVARDIKEVHIFNRTKDKARSFIEKAKEAFPDIRFHMTEVDELVRESDIIITTTTSVTPVLPELPSEVWKGKQIVAVGSFRPAMQEIPDQVLKEADYIYVDAESALRESGDMLRAKELRTDLDGSWNLEKIITERHEPEDVENKLTIFKSVGASIFDLVTVEAIYNKYDK
ncbi:NAD(P)-binding domain-containing protein [Salimicrobium sp. PL1-032A]|uniref:ornithine cyclodeaminase family protein n=1 Tax=Salimicrobium sp. PL1-032A TaxID=3095364 RepID=UPI00326128C5